MIRERAPAKINLFLHIAGRRGDGYHELESLVVFSEFGDELEIDIGAPKLSLNVSGPAVGDWTLPWETLDNSVMKAAMALQSRAKRAGAAIRLTKNIPIAAGLGGGSADAAATLRALDDGWGLDLDEPELDAIALKLGADVPVCLRSQATWMSGIGEQLAPVGAMPPFAIVIAHTRRMLPTLDVFDELQESDWSEEEAPPEEPWPDVHALIEFLSETRNDLEAPAIRLQPQIADLLRDIGAQKGCLLARMSGSGAACFGIFAENVGAKAGAAALNEKGWWAVATRLQN
jgi:4-diphosphocytidyl-2-C-methyl-D-erythritol kinase